MTPHIRPIENFPPSKNFRVGWTLSIRRRKIFAQQQFSNATPRVELLSPSRIQGLFAGHSYHTLKGSPSKRGRTGHNHGPDGTYIAKRQQLICAVYLEYYQNTFH